jgi:hypothetical protein
MLHVLVILFLTNSLITYIKFLLSLCTNGRDEFDIHNCKLSEIWGHKIHTSWSYGLPAKISVHLWAVVMTSNKRSNYQTRSSLLYGNWKILCSKTIMSVVPFGHKGAAHHAELLCDAV